MPQLWTIREWASNTGSFLEEYNAQPGEVQAAFDVALRFLSHNPPSVWRLPQTRPLKRECEGLIEIRFLAGKVQQRPLGYHGPGRMVFTLLFWATEKGDKFVPPDACKIALKRKKQVENDGCSRTFDVE